MKGIPVVMGPLGEVEHERWKELFNEFCLANGLTREQANDKKYRAFFHSVCAWGNAYLRLRYAQVQNGEWSLDCEDTIL